MTSLHLYQFLHGTFQLYDEDTATDQEETGKGGGLSFYPDTTTEDTDDERIFELKDEF